MAKQFTLGKDERLKSRKLIEQLFSEGKSFYVQPFKIQYLVTDKMFNAQSRWPPGSMPHVQFAVGVPTKNFKKAVDRNKIKRLTREAYRLQKKELQETVKQKERWLIIFFIYLDSTISDFNTIKIKVNVALKKLLQLSSG